MLNKLAIVTTLLIVTASSAAAMPVRTVYENDANSNAIELKVWKGYGLTINLMSTGETIKQVWIGDPSRFAFTSNGALCQSSGNDSDCTGGKATVIFLRQIDPIKFPVTSSSNGSTQITLLTNENLYQFKIVPASGNPAYTSLVIKSDSARPLPISRPRTPLPLTVEKTAISAASSPAAFAATTTKQ
ncbi:hypothetical protein GTQ43_39260 [Nostoc sp. KVJ3]|uniref:hypothetical protein n=1 Tax=Nostoc sp. KVJ3 TaxID=457945 RepID=UPI0022385CAA|nr:hypothetical protein [Nostoc sp. KVJ3]MCW5319390.1 hypothetical protein [Nostoc sp. KVJ3]